MQMLHRILALHFSLICIQLAGLTEKFYDEIMTSGVHPISRRAFHLSQRFRSFTAPDDQLLETLKHEADQAHCFRLPSRSTSAIPCYHSPVLWLHLPR
jgi:hypothetical protein